MTKIWKRTGLATTIAVLTAASVLMVGGVAHADTIQHTIADSGTGVTLVAGSPVAGSAGIRLIGNNAQQDPDPGCNIDSGEAPLVLNVVTPAGVTAAPNPVSISACNTDFAVGFTAAATAVSGTVTVTVASGPAGGGTYVNQVSIPITITQPVPTNTKPTAAVAGVTNGAVYEIGAVPAATCVITDKEDGAAATATPVVTGTLTNGLGTQTATCGYTDKGLLAATTATATYTIADTGDPTITHTLFRVTPDGANGWYISSVDVDFACSDGGSGIASCDGDTTLTDGANQSVTGTATDWAGRTATDTVSGISIDTIDPTISHTLAEAMGANGWHLADVAVGFSCADIGGSGIASCAGGTTLSDGADQSVTGIATDVAGRTKSDTVTGISIDTIDPTVGIALNKSVPDGKMGWYVTDVGVVFTCTDLGSGIQSCTPGTTLTDGADQFVTGTATDKAGRTATDTVTGISIDTTDPTISHTLAATKGANSWYTSDVAVSFECIDGGSGIDDCAGDTTLTDGRNQSVTGTATDVAGNTAEDTASGIYVDTIDPSISATLNAPAPDGDNGWYVTKVAVGFVCEDAGSGMDTCVGATVLGEGAGQTATGTATDVAGNTASVPSKAVNIDLTAPNAPTFVGGPTGSYYFGSDPAKPTCESSDSLSGLASCIVTGGGSSVGAQSYTATATDFAGNTSTAKLNYTVLAWTLNGFYSPVDMGGIWNTVKGGSTVPLKFEIFAGSTELTSVSAVKSFTAVAVTCPNSSAVTDAIELTTTGGTSLRFDSTGGQFIQNWATPKKPGTCAKVTMTAQDGSSIVANFILK